VYDVYKLMVNVPLNGVVNCIVTFRVTVTLLIYFSHGFSCSSWSCRVNCFLYTYPAILGMSKSLSIYFYIYIYTLI